MGWSGIQEARHREELSAMADLLTHYDGFHTLHLDGVASLERRSTIILIYGIKTPIKF
jgi:hypothetical protein